MPIGMSEWDGTPESAQEINRALNDVLDVLVNAGMWTGDPPYRGKSAAEQVRMLVQRAEAAEALAAQYREWHAEYGAKAGEFAAERDQLRAALAAVPVLSIAHLLRTIAEQVDTGIGVAEWLNKQIEIMAQQPEVHP